jgi:hypothetical protein
VGCSPAAPRLGANRPRSSGALAVGSPRGLVTYIDRRPVDVDLARRQHGEYVAALHASGWTIREVPADDLPDSVFVEDTVVIFDELAVVRDPALSNAGRRWTRSSLSSVTSLAGSRKRSPH